MVLIILINLQLLVHINGYSRYQIMMSKELREKINGRRLGYIQQNSKTVAQYLVLI